ncbi:MAG: hypothetical protein ABFD98_08240 [Syntrophobacteraceae bacterium]|nr:hypothetical protein [Desulfobacteraceae bacterium]
MTKGLFHMKGTTCLGSIGCYDDRKPRSGININPPPSDGHCACCGRHVSELRRFGKAGDSEVDDFDDERLVKTWKRFYPRDAERERLWEQYFDNCHTEEDFEGQRRLYDEEFGTDAALNLDLYLSASDQIENEKHETILKEKIKC